MRGLREKGIGKELQANEESCTYIGENGHLIVYDIVFLCIYMFT